MTSPDQQPHPVDMWAICDPQGNIMDSTVMLKQKDAIYNGTVWGRCGDDRTLADFKREGYRVIRVHVVPFSAPKNDPPAIAAAARAEAIIECRKIVGNKVIFNTCPFNGDCAQCFLCDNTGGCIVESTEEISNSIKAAYNDGRAEGAREERESVLPKLILLKNAIQFPTDIPQNCKYLRDCLLDNCRDCIINELIEALRSQQPDGEDEGAG